MIPRPCEVCGGSTFREIFMKEDHHFVRCTDCRLIRIDPQPTEQTLDEIYGAHYYDAWGVTGNTPSVRNLKCATFRRHLRTVSDLSPGARVLDCGAAFGFLMEMAAEMGFDPYGIERATDAAERIGERFGKDHVFIGAFEQASFSGLGPRPFDLVCMFDFLEHVRSPLATLHKAADLLAPGGHLLITTPANDSLSRYLMGASWLHFKLEHLYYFNRRNVAQLLTATNFHPVQFRSARKIMNFEYVSHQLNTYRRAGLTGTIKFIRSVLPQSVRGSHFPVVFGEMLVHARRA